VRNFSTLSLSLNSKYYTQSKEPLPPPLAKNTSIFVFPRSPQRLHRKNTSHSLSLLSFTILLTLCVPFGSGGNGGFALLSVVLILFPILCSIFHVNRFEELFSLMGISLIVKYGWSRVVLVLCLG